MPDAEYLYACDSIWWDKHIEDVKKTFHGELYTQWHKPEHKAVAEKNGLTAVEGAHNTGLGSDKLHFNSNSGAQAINLAYMKGATGIYLLGYDMGWTGGKKHWFGDHPHGLSNCDPGTFVNNFNKLASDLNRAGVEVVNLSRSTRLTQFKRATLDNYDTYLHWIG